MSNYVLVHGGDRDSSIWDEVATLLIKQGHKVFCPSMESVTTASLTKNIDEVVNLIEPEGIDNIILCGHSYGAMVIAGVFDKTPNKIAHLNFIDSVIPMSGLSLYGILEEYGFNYKGFGLTKDRACFQEIYFDEARLAKASKSYIHCLQGEFFNVTKCAYTNIKSSGNDWLYFPLDTSHGCMFTQPIEVAVILAGLSILM